MSDDVFRIVVTVAVGLACLAALVVVGVAFAFYRTARRMQQKVDELANIIEPVIGKIGPVVDQIGPVIDKIGPVLDSAAPVIERCPRRSQSSRMRRRSGPWPDRLFRSWVESGR